MDSKRMDSEGGQAAYRGGEYKDFIIANDAASLAMLYIREQRAPSDAADAMQRDHQWQEIAGHYEENPAIAENINALHAYLEKFPRTRTADWRPGTADEYEREFPKVSVQATKDLLAHLLRIRRELLRKPVEDIKTAKQILEFQSAAMLEQLGFPNRNTRSVKLSGLRPDTVMAAVMTGKLQLAPQAPPAAA